MKFVARVKRLYTDSKIPTHGSEDAAGYDLYAHIPSDDADIVMSNEDKSEQSKQIIIHPHETRKIGTGVAITPPCDYFGAIFARSGLATKQSLRPANCVGCADFDYTGEYIVALHNDSDIPQMVEDGERIAQLVFLPYITPKFKEVEELDATDRGAGGFGSTGKK